MSFHLVLHSLSIKDRSLHSLRSRHPLRRTGWAAALLTLNVLHGAFAADSDRPVPEPDEELPEAQVVPTPSPAGSPNAVSQAQPGDDPDSAPPA